MEQIKVTHCYGSEEGATCRRDGCMGVICIAPSENCSCHLHPPCGSCTAPRMHCDQCDWREVDDIETHMNGYDIKENRSGLISSYRERELDPTKIDYRVKSHSNSSQLCEGVYPEGATQADVERLTKGTFGGRFEMWGGGRFRYIAYTD